MPEPKPVGRSMPVGPRELGRLGEAAARQLLESRNLRTVATNVRTRYGEIDLIARDGPELVFVEVKSRVVNARVAPLDAITRVRADRMTRLAEAYLCERGQDVPWRIDVVAVYVANSGQVLRIEHVPHALSE